MKNWARVLALDGHDGTGKTTLAKLLAEQVGAFYVRPFAGERGKELMEAYTCGDLHRVIDVGKRAIANAVDASVGPIILDRGWLTVSTLLPRDVFVGQWKHWIPTVLLTCGLSTVMNRLSYREDETPESAQWHQDFLDLYLERSSLREVQVIHTDCQAVDKCLRELISIFALNQDRQASHISTLQ